MGGGLSPSGTSWGRLLDGLLLEINTLLFIKLGGFREWDYSPCELQSKWAHCLRYLLLNFCQLTILTSAWMNTTSRTASNISSSRGLTAGETLNKSSLSSYDICGVPIGENTN